MDTNFDIEDFFKEIGFISENNPVYSEIQSSGKIKSDLDDPLNFIKSEHKDNEFTDIKELSLKLSQHNEMVKEIERFKIENEKLRKQSVSLNESASNVRLMYQKEHTMLNEMKNKNEKLFIELSTHQQQIENLKKSIENDQYIQEQAIATWESKWKNLNNLVESLINYSFSVTQEMIDCEMLSAVKKKEIMSIKSKLVKNKYVIPDLKYLSLKNKTSKLKNSTNTIEKLNNINSKEVLNECFRIPENTCLTALPNKNKVDKYTQYICSSITRAVNTDSIISHSVGVNFPENIDLEEKYSEQLIKPKINNRMDKNSNHKCNQNLDLIKNEEPIMLLWKLLGDKLFNIIKNHDNTLFEYINSRVTFLHQAVISKKDKEEKNFGYLYSDTETVAISPTSDYSETQFSGDSVEDFLRVKPEAFFEDSQFHRETGSKVSSIINKTNSILCKKTDDPKSLFDNTINNNLRTPKHIEDNPACTNKNLTLNKDLKQNTSNTKPNTSKPHILYNNQNSAKTSKTQYKNNKKPPKINTSLKNILFDLSESSDEEASLPKISNINSKCIEVSSYFENPNKELSIAKDIKIRSSQNIQNAKCFKDAYIEEVNYGKKTLKQNNNKQKTPSSEENKSNKNLLLEKSPPKSSNNMNSTLDNKNNEPTNNEKCISIFSQLDIKNYEGSPYTISPKIATINNIENLAIDMSKQINQTLKTEIVGFATSNENNVNQNKIFSNKVNTPNVLNKKNSTPDNKNLSSNPEKFISIFSPLDTKNQEGSPYTIEKPVTNMSKIVNEAFKIQTFDFTTANEKTFNDNKIFSKKLNSVNVSQKIDENESSKNNISKLLEVDFRNSDTRLDKSPLNKTCKLSDTDTDSSDSSFHSKESSLSDSSDSFSDSSESTANTETELSLNYHFEEEFNDLQHKQKGNKLNEEKYAKSQKKIKLLFSNTLDSSSDSDCYMDVINFKDELPLKSEQNANENPKNMNILFSDLFGDNECKSENSSDLLTTNLNNIKTHDYCKDNSLNNLQTDLYLSSSDESSCDINLKSYFNKCNEISISAKSENFDPDSLKKVPSKLNNINHINQNVIFQQCSKNETIDKQKLSAVEDTDSLSNTLFKSENNGEELFSCLSRINNPKSENISNDNISFQPSENKAQELFPYFKSINNTKSGNISNNSSFKTLENKVEELFSCSKNIDNTESKNMSNMSKKTGNPASVKRISFFEETTQKQNFANEVQNDICNSLINNKENKIFTDDLSVDELSISNNIFSKAILKNPQSLDDQLLQTNIVDNNVLLKLNHDEKSNSVKSRKSSDQIVLRRSSRKIPLVNNILKAKEKIKIDNSMNDISENAVDEILKLFPQVKTTRKIRNTINLHSKNVGNLQNIKQSNIILNKSLTENNKYECSNEFKRNGTGNNNKSNSSLKFSPNISTKSKDKDIELKNFKRDKCKRKLYENGEFENQNKLKKKSRLQNLKNSLCNIEVKTEIKNEFYSTCENICKNISTEQQLENALVENIWEEVKSPKTPKDLGVNIDLVDNSIIENNATVLSPIEGCSFTNTNVTKSTEKLIEECLDDSTLNFKYFNFNKENQISVEDSVTKQKTSAEINEIENICFDLGTKHEILKSTSVIDSPISPILNLNLSKNTPVIIPLEISSPLSVSDNNLNFSPGSPILKLNEKYNSVNIPLERNILQNKGIQNKFEKEESFIKNFLKAFNPLHQEKIFEKLNLNKKKTKMETLEKLKNILDHYIDGPANTEQVKKCIFRLLQITKVSKLICKAIIEIIEISKNKAKIELTELSETEGKIIVLTNKFNSHIKEFKQNIIAEIHNKIFTLKTNKIPLENLMNLIKFNILVMDLQNSNANEDDRKMARLLIFKCFYYYHAKAIPMVFQLLISYPSVLPRKNNPFYNDSDPIIKTIQSILNCTPFNMAKIDLRHHEMFYLLKDFYNYERVKPSREELIEFLLTKITKNNFEDISISFALICKHHGIKWAEHFVIKQKILPLLNEYYIKISDTDENDKRIECMFESLSYILKTFPLDFKNFEKYLQIFKNFLFATNRKCIQQAAVCAILRTSRFGFVNTFTAIVNWKPNFKVDNFVKLMIQSFLYKKPLFYWTKIQNQIKE